MTPPTGRRCDATGIRLVPGAAYPRGWRVAKERYVSTGGITAVRENRIVGPAAASDTTPRGRFDTIGRTVYFGLTDKVALAEVLQPFRLERVAVQADAMAIGMDVETYMHLVAKQAAANGLVAPWCVSADWHMDRCLHEVTLPQFGWWVDVDHPDTLNRLSLDLADELGRHGLGQIDLGVLTGDDRAVTTIVAQHIRSSMLDDGTYPLGIVYESKLGYGSAFAWWDRRADDGLLPGKDDPSTVDDLAVGVPAFYEVLREFGLGTP